MPTKKEIKRIIELSQEKLKKDLEKSIHKRQPQAEYRSGTGVPEDIIEALKTASEDELRVIRKTLGIKVKKDDSNAL